ncbi:MAG: hypothetical protein ABII74_00355 [Elusimicrobiota bacterium]
MKLDFSKVKTYPLKKRKSKVNYQSFSQPLKKNSSFKIFFDSLPQVLAGKDFKDLVVSIVKAHRKNKPVIVMSGAHLVKCGLSPILIELINRKIVTALAANGAFYIHDFELAYSGQTSEDVAAALNDGSFGLAEETGSQLNLIAKKAAETGSTFGETLGKLVSEEKFVHQELSVSLAAYRQGIPATVHAAIGTDIIYQHPSCEGSAWGKASFQDFQRLVEVVARLGEGGVVLNIGSAVIMPEVFLKALNLARNLGYPVKNFTTANFDMLMQYRSRENVVHRPVLKGGKGFYLIGHHEIMIPLLYQAIMESL